jgi:uncharacterized protein
MYDLPLFPLDTVLFPGMPLHLHIFEPRYRLLMRGCIAENKPFGVVLIRSGLEAGGPAQPFDVGCTARIVKVENLPDGRFNLTALGEERFLIHGLNRDLPHLVGRVSWLPLDHPQTLHTTIGAHALAPWVRRYLAQISRLAPDLTVDLTSLQLPEDALMLLYWAATLLQIPAREKQPLLEAGSAAELLRQVTRLYRRETALLGSAGGQLKPERLEWMN